MVFGYGGFEGWSVDGKDSWFFKKDEVFIGVMGDLGVYKIDMFCYILNEEIVEVGVFVESNVKDFVNVDDNVVCVLKMESGIIGMFVVSWVYNGKEDNFMIVYGEKGIFCLEDDLMYLLVV